jgi:hypothetical protein
MHGVFKLRSFNRWMQKIRLSDQNLCEAVKDMMAGLIDAELGGNIVKKRIPLPGQGKRGATRTLLATNRKNRWIFVYGFEKNERENITHKELEVLQDLAITYLNLSDDELGFMIGDGKILEVVDGN